MWLRQLLCFMSHGSLRRGRTARACSTERLATQRRGLHEPPLARPLPTSRHPQPAAGGQYHGLWETPVSIPCGPREVSAWAIGQIGFVVWPNNFFSCQFIEKMTNKNKLIIIIEKAHLTSFNTACGVLISHVFLGPYFLPCDLSSNSIFHSCYRKSLFVTSNIQLHLSLLEKM